MQDGEEGRARRTAVAVCGSGVVDAQVAEIAREVGRRIVAAGCALVTGGLGGVMAAASEGGWQARQAGGSGIVVGIVPQQQASAANRFCEVVVPTGMGVARNVLVVRAADVVILVAGGAGTLSEAAYAWQFGKPIVAIESSGGCAERLAGTAIDDRRADEVIGVATASEAVDRALALVGQSEENDLRQ